MRKILIFIIPLIFINAPLSYAGKCNQMIQNASRDISAKQNYCQDVLEFVAEETHFGKLWKVLPDGKFIKIKNDANSGGETLVKGKTKSTYHIDYSYGDTKATFKSFEKFDDGKTIQRTNAQVLYDKEGMLKEVRFASHGSAQMIIPLDRVSQNRYIFDNVNSKCYLAEQRQGTGKGETIDFNINFCKDILDLEDENLYTCNGAYPPDIQMNKEKCADPGVNKKLLKIYMKNSFEYKKQSHLKPYDISQEEINELCSSKNSNYIAITPLGRAVNALGNCMVFNEHVYPKVLAELKGYNNSKIKTATVPPSTSNR
ncbi:MAG: hypothetical protein IPM57_05245 [Oligoflexia bacterium]|nr:hypothetical protein [Oligoflexia bacterium]